MLHLYHIQLYAQIEANFSIQKISDIMTSEKVALNAEGIELRRLLPDHHGWHLPNQ